MASCDQEEGMVIDRRIVPKGKICVKCKVAVPVITVRNDAFCKPCYMVFFSGKFRRTVSKSHALGSKPGERTFLAFSGGSSSRAMLELISQFIYAGPNEFRKAQLFSGVTVCHLDESALFGPIEGTSEKIEKIVKENYPSFSFVPVRLEDAFSEEFTSSGDFQRVLEMVTTETEHENNYFAEVKQAPSMLTANSSNKDKLLSFFSHISSLTAKEDILWHLKLNLLIHTAKKQGCTSLFLGESSTRLAIKIISLTSKGRGYSLPFDVGTEVTIFDDLVILRPMKDMLSKEIAIWNKYTGLDQDVFIETGWNTLQSEKSSIERLTEAFVVGLDRDFPSTVSTISRTAAKLTPMTGMNMEKICTICSMPIQKDIKEWRARISKSSADISEPHSESTQAPPSSTPVLPTNSHIQICSCDANWKNCSVHTPSTIRISLFDYLCYNCQINMRDFRLEESIIFPPYIAERLEKEVMNETTTRNMRSNMRTQLGEFLLSNEEEEEE